MANNNINTFNSFEALGRSMGIEPTPVPETIGFLGREEEFSRLNSFFKSTQKRIFEAYGVPLIGKTTLTREFCDRNNIVNIRIRLRQNPHLPVQDIQEQLFKNQPWNNFSEIEPNTLLIIENFEQALEWASKIDHLHEIKYPEIHDFLNKVRQSGLKLVIESRFQIRFHPEQLCFVQSEPLVGISPTLFWEYYSAKSFSLQQFDTLCEKFNDHTGLLALAYNEASFRYENQLLKAIREPTATSNTLWKFLQDIIKKLQKPEKQLLAALTLLQRPISIAELQTNLVGYFKGKIDPFLLSLRKKLLATSSTQAEYSLNPYIAEVCYSFLEQSNEITELKKLPAFKEVVTPKYDPIKQASDKGDYKTFYRSIKELQANRKFEEAHQALNYALEYDFVINQAGVLNEIGVTYKLQKNYPAAKDALDKARKLGNIHSFNELAIIYKEEENYEEAKKILKDALDIESNNTKILNELAIIYKLQRNYKEARKTLEQSLDINSNDVITLNQLGIIYKLEKNYEKAKETVDKGLKIDSNDRFLKQTLRDIQRELQNNQTKKTIKKTPDVVVKQDKAKKIMFLTADPTNTNPIGALEQKQKIDDLVGEIWDFNDNLHTKYNEIDVLSQGKDVIHVTVHCENNELHFVHDKEKAANPISSDYFCCQIRDTKEIKELILLIACKSEQIAQQIFEQELTKYAIGTTTDISSQAAIDFSSMFYKKLKEKSDIVYAFNMTCYHLNQDKFRAKHDEEGQPSYDYNKVFKLFHNKK